MYRIVFLLTGVFAVALGLLLLLAPDVYLSLYVPATEGGAFAARRLSPAIMGLGGLLMLLSALPAGRLAAQIALVAALVWFGVAATGIYAYVTDAAKFPIIVAAVSEVILGVVFLLAAKSHRYP